MIDLEFVSIFFILKPVNRVLDFLQSSHPLSFAIFRLPRFWYRHFLICVNWLFLCVVVGERISWHRCVPVCAMLDYSHQRLEFPAQQRATMNEPENERWKSLNKTPWIPARRCAYMRKIFVHCVAFSVHGAHHRCNTHIFNRNFWFSPHNFSLLLSLSLAFSTQTHTHTQPQSHCSWCAVFFFSFCLNGNEPCLPNSCISNYYGGAIHVPSHEDYFIVMWLSTNKVTNRWKTSSSHHEHRAKNTSRAACAASIANGCEW